MIRPARPSDAEALTGIARAAKASWGYPEDWLREWEPQLTFTPEYVEAHTVLVATDDDRPIGVIALQATAEPEIAHLWVTPAAHGRGIGRRLVERAAEHASTRGWASLRIESDPGAVPFYRRMGAVCVGEVAAPVCGTDRVLPLLRLKV